MRLQRYVFTVPVAAGIGVLHYFVLEYVWYFIAIHTPIPGWLRQTALTASSRHEALLVCDALTNVLLAVPAAWALAALRPRNLPLYLVLAIVPSFLWDFRLLLFAPLPAALSVFLPGALMYLVILPLVAAAIRRATPKRVAAG